MGAPLPRAHFFAPRREFGGRFPKEWNRKDLYVTHGAADANVPPDELSTFDGQDRSIVAWFDKWLKGQPAFWDERYSKKLIR